jgi:predicted DNA-binding transcriptional regulator YafY
LRILYLSRIFLEESDETHGLTMPEIIDRLDALEIQAERRAIYDDIRLLREFGLDVITRRGRVTEYFIGGRDFEYQEMTLLVDAVQSSKFLTEKKCTTLVKKLASLVSVHEGKQLHHRIHVAGRIKTQNESIYYNLDAIQNAISRKRRISFRYYDYDLEKRRVARGDDKIYIASPIGLVYADDNYYLITYNGKWDDFVTYRVDRMMRIGVLEERADRVPREKRFDIRKFVERSFSMFGGEDMGVTLVFDKSMMNAIVERFGKDVPVRKVNGDTARVRVEITKSNTFFGWLTQFDGMIRIKSPESLIVEYKAYLKRLIIDYD